MGAHAARGPGASAATVRIAKYVLPLAALALLSSIALWPELTRTVENGRVTWRRLTMATGAGMMMHPRYHGLDGRERPYTISADTAEREGPNRVNLAAPVGDATLQNGTWLLLRAKKGIYLQHANELDLADAVTLFRQDGTTMTSQSATMNLKQGSGNQQRVHSRRGAVRHARRSGLHVGGQGGRDPVPRAGQAGIEWHALAGTPCLPQRWPACRLSDGRSPSICRMAARLA